MSDHRARLRPLSIALLATVSLWTAPTPSADAAPQSFRDAHGVPEWTQLVAALNRPGAQGIDLIAGGAKAFADASDAAAAGGVLIVFDPLGGPLPPARFDGVRKFASGFDALEPVLSSLEALPVIRFPVAADSGELASPPWISWTWYVSWLWAELDPPRAGRLATRLLRIAQHVQAETRVGLRLRSEMERVALSLIERHVVAPEAWDRLDLKACEELLGTLEAANIESWRQIQLARASYILWLIERLARPGAQVPFGVGETNGAVPEFPLRASCQAAIHEAPDAVARGAERVLGPWLEASRVGPAAARRLLVAARAPRDAESCEPAPDVGEWHIWLVHVAAVRLLRLRLLLRRGGDGIAAWRELTATPLPSEEGTEFIRDPLTGGAFRRDGDLLVSGPAQGEPSYVPEEIAALLRVTYRPR
jgi:hypothetical protein